MFRRSVTVGKNKPVLMQGFMLADNWGSETVVSTFSTKIWRPTVH